MVEEEPTEKAIQIFNEKELNEEEVNQNDKEEINIEKDKESVEVNGKGKGKNHDDNTEEKIDEEASKEQPESHKTVEHVLENPSFVLVQVLVEENQAGVEQP